METTIKTSEGKEIKTRIEGNILHLGGYYKIDLIELYSLLDFSELPPLSDCLQDVLLSLSQLMAEQINDPNSKYIKVAPESVSLWHLGKLINAFQNIQVFK